MTKAQNKTHKIVFVADPIEKFDPIAETTFYIMKEVCQRGWSCYHLRLDGIFVKDKTPHGLCQRIEVTHSNDRFSCKIIETQPMPLTEMDAVFLRKDPPVDLSFIDHLSVLELLDGKTCLINHPTWVKVANEKLFTLHFSDLAPRTLVAQKRSLIRDFVKSEKRAILKPLNLSGGRGVVLVNADDPSLDSLIDILTDYQSRYIMVQEFVPEALQGDKRILILDGEIIGSFLRVPSDQDFRGNLHSGAKLKATELTKRDHDIVDQIRSRLRNMGLYFVGIDIIGNYVTEINSTSPMGIREINHIDNSQTEKIVVDWLQKKLTNPINRQLPS